MLSVLVLFTQFASAQRAPIPQQLTFTPYHSTGIYKIGETVGWTVVPGPVTPTYAYKYTVRRDNNVVLKEGKLDLSSGKDTIEIAGDQPEMIYVAIEPYAVLPSAAPAADATTAASRRSSRQCRRTFSHSRSRRNTARPFSLYRRQHGPQ